MFQPFQIFSKPFITRLQRLNKIYLVSQTYEMGSTQTDDVKKVVLLVSDYDDIGLAKVHLNAIKLDKYASIIDLTNTKHETKLMEMLAEESSYKVYWAIIKSKENLKKRFDSVYKDAVRKWISKNTDWRINNAELIKPNLQVIFGEVFVVIKRGSHEIRIKIQELEKF